MRRNRLADKTIKHQQKMRGQLTRITRQSAAHLTTLKKLISDELASTQNLKNAAQLRKTLSTIDALVISQYALLSKEVQNEMADLFLYEAEWSQRAFGVKVDALMSQEKVLAVVSSDPFDGKILKEWISEQTLSTQNKIKQTVRMGVLNGLGPRDVASSLVGSKVFDGSLRNAEILVRTAGNHFTAKADEAVFKKVGFESYQLSSVLDTRTTEICASLDGKVFKMSDPGKLMPPFHPGCRTIMIPITGDDLPIKENYEMWLSKQSKEDQIESLGKERYKLWIAGDKLDSFVDTNTMSVIPLSELRSKRS